VAFGGHGDTAGRQSGVRHVGDSVPSQLDDERGVEKPAGDGGRGTIWEAAGDKHPMTEAVFPHPEVDELMDGAGWTWKVVDPTAALESRSSDGTGVFPPPQFLWNDVFRLVWPSPSGPSMAMDTIVLVELAPQNSAS